jgi:hypothetical protein
MERFYKDYGAYTIRFCERADVPAFMRFIDERWERGQILSQSRKVVDWQFYNSRYDRYDILLGTDNASGEIIGIIGYTPTYRFDDSIGDADKYIWLVGWKVRDDAPQTALGLQLMQAVFAAESTKNVGTVGMVKRVEPLYSAMKFQIGTLEHYFIANDCMAEYKLLRGVRPISKPCDSAVDTVDLSQEAALDSFFRQCGFWPLKTKGYYVTRYLKNPFYQYRIIGFLRKGEPVAFAVYREVSATGAKALRVVDFCGDMNALCGAYSRFQILLQERGAEYVDMYCHGLDNAAVTRAGFTCRATEDGVVVPNYFEPYSPDNVEIYFAYHLETDRPYQIFKGDCDRDRPYVITWEES